MNPKPKKRVKPIRAWAIWNTLYNAPYGLSLGCKAEIFNTRLGAKGYAKENIPKYRIVEVEIRPIKRVGRNKKGELK